MSRSWLAATTAYKFAVVVGAEVKERERGGDDRGKGERESEMEQEGGPGAESGCWLRKNKTNRLLTPFFPSAGTLHENSLNWSTKRARLAAGTPL